MGVGWGGGGGAQDEEVSPSGQTIIKVNSKKQTQPCLTCLFTVSHLNLNAQTRILSAERGDVGVNIQFINMLLDFRCLNINKCIRHAKLTSILRRNHVSSFFEQYNVYC